MTVLPRSLRRTLIAAATAATLIVLTACTGASAPTPTPLPVSSETPAALEPFYGQEVSWTSCERSFTCADITAPMDWNNPEAGSITLSVVRHAATGKDRLGSLFVNPGGPGASGYDLVAKSLDFAVSADLSAAYDVIGFDPRGVARSTPVTCLNGAQMDEYLYGLSTTTRGTPAWIAESAAQAKSFGQACAENTGESLEFVTTVSAARDLDLLRALVGDTKLNYLGYSYGTFLGATYADLYPENTGRLVLDGALDPAASNADVTRIQAQGFESALRAYLQACVAGENCPFSGGVDAAMNRVGKLLDTVDAHPIANSDGRKLGANTLFTAIITPLYSQDGWAQLSSMFADVFAGNATSAFAFADSYNGRQGPGEYADNQSEAFTAYNCRDYRYNADPAAMAAQAKELVAAAPVFGKYMGYGDIGCANWPYPDGAERTAIHAPGAADILVIGTTNDPATPYVWAQALATELESGHLVTYHGEGHTAYNKGNSCVTGTVDSYFLKGTVPDSDPDCS